MNNRNRRNALKLLAVGAPAAWSKPVVDSVVLPVHATLSFTLTCTKQPQSDSANVPANCPADSFATISPAPSIGTPVFAEHFCDGQEVSTSLNRQTDENGVAEDGFNLTPNLCSGGSVFVTRFTYQGVVAECTWNVIDPGACLDD